MSLDEIEPPEHFQPESILHKEEHPSPFFLLPSSHSLSFSLTVIPSPQISTQYTPLDNCHPTLSSHTRH